MQKRVDLDQLRLGLRGDGGADLKRAQAPSRRKQRIMLTAEKNELLTRVGPGTPMGDLLRRYW